MVWTAPAEQSNDLILAQRCREQKTVHTIVPLMGVARLRLAVACPCGILRHPKGRRLPNWLRTRTGEQRS